MDLRQLTPDLAVSPQILPEDLPALAEAGFRVLINNRPDAEVGPAENDAAMRAAANNRMQTSLNLAIGSAIATIGLTIPAVIIVSLVQGWSLNVIFPF